MRYFYYGTDHDRMGQHRETQTWREENPREEFVEEEDTVYEIDRACVECHKKIKERKR
jgi:hypothetical protein